METPIPVSLVIQEQMTYCFPACLQSYLKDIGVEASQKEIVRRNPVEFKQGSDKEGALKPQELTVVMDEWKLKAEFMTDGRFTIHPGEAVFLTLDWLGETSSRHWIRFIGYDTVKERLLFMEPSGRSDFPAELSPAQMKDWRVLVFKISKGPDFNVLRANPTRLRPAISSPPAQQS